MSNKNEIMATKMGNFLTSNSDKIHREMPEGYSMEKVKRLALHLMQANDRVQNCTPQSIYLGVLKSAHLDLSFDLGECHLVPYGKEADFQIDYKGLIKLVKRSGEVLNVKADVVREGDEFGYQRGLRPEDRYLVHRPKTFSEANIIGAYVIFDLAHGENEFEVISRKELDAIRSKASGGSMMWNDFFEEAAKKAVIRRGIKTLELYPDDKRALIEEAQVEYQFDNQPARSSLNDRFGVTQQPKALTSETKLDEEIPVEAEQTETEGEIVV